MSLKYHQKDGVEIEEDEFDTYVDKDTGRTLSVRRFTWRNSSGVSVQVITYGATITSIKLPDKNGSVDDIVMGFDDMKGYLEPLNPYFGATVGRVANRIGYARITIDTQTYNVTANLGEHTLHGGNKGFDKVNWNHYVDGTKVTLSYLSKDLEEGFPGDVITNVTFELTNDNQFLVDFKATSSKPTFVNLTNHSYFNLAGHGSGAEEVYKHLISINADYTTDVDKNSIPSGNLLPVADTIFDLRIPKVLGDVISNIPGYLGYDHNFCVTKGSAQENTFVARAVHPPTGRILEVYSNQPGVQFYTSNHIPEDPKGDVAKLSSLTGKGGAKYFKHGSFCFETQNYPDAVNHVNWNHYVDGTKVTLSYLSKDLEEGFPGDVITNVTFELTIDNQFLVDFKATSSKPTFVNLTNHSYFNLAGHGSGAEEAYKHLISINADYTTDVDELSIPSGKFLPVADTIFDLRIPKVLGDVISNIPGYLGYNHNFCVTKGSAQENTLVARAVHPPTGRILEVYSNQPGVQFYTSNHIPEDPKGDVAKLSSLTGKGGAKYFKHGSFCFETQNYPDAVNHVNTDQCHQCGRCEWWATCSSCVKSSRADCAETMDCVRRTMGKRAVWMSVDDFGSYIDKSGETRNVKRFNWGNSANTTVQVINWGATITSIKVPAKDGTVDDIVTGFDTIDEYLGPKNRYYGATIGRVANRTAEGKMTIEDVEYSLAINNGPNHLHGGIQGFDKVLWNYHTNDTKVILTYHSADLEENYPGDLLATITFNLTASNEFHIDYKATVTKPCPVNLTNHSYFNLGGHGSGAEELYKHEITINADRYTEVDQNSIPTGNLPTVSGTVFDLRVPKVLGDVIKKVPNSPGYNHNYCVTKASSQDVGFVAKAYHPPSGRIMEVYSNQPGVQFYTGNFLPETNSSRGKKATYKKHGAFCFETQIYPDAVHHANFPDVIVYPGDVYYHLTIFKFLVQK